MKKLLVIFILVLVVANSCSVLAEARTEKEKTEVGLALSGGAAWGLAHIGVLEVLVENEIEIDYIAGTSAGSIVGSLYASGVSPEEMKEIAEDITWIDLLRPVISDLGLFNSEQIEKFIKENIKENQFSRLQIGLSVVATDLATGEVVILEKGKVSRAVTASSAIPVIFEPVEYREKKLVDGGLANNLPLDVVNQQDVDIVVGVDVASSFSIAEFPRSKTEVGIRSYNIIQKHQTDYEGADVVIKPDLEGIRGTDFSAHKKMIARGRDAAREMLPEIKKLLD
ncbi:MAG: patatin-like phospholipase family protein [Halanaerobiaceae bacterium]